MEHLIGSHRYPSYGMSHSDGDSVAIGIIVSLPPPPTPTPSPLFPSLISRMVSVDVRHHVYLLTRLKPELHDVKIYNIHIMSNQQHVFARFRRSGFQCCLFWQWVLKHMVVNTLKTESESRAIALTENERGRTCVINFQDFGTNYLYAYMVSGCISQGGFWLPAGRTRMNNNILTVLCDISPN